MRCFARFCSSLCESFGLETGVKGEWYLQALEFIPLSVRGRYIIAGKQATRKRELSTLATYNPCDSILINMREIETASIESQAGTTNNGSTEKDTCTSIQQSVTAQEETEESGGRARGATRRTRRRKAEGITLRRSTRSRPQVDYSPRPQRYAHCYPGTETIQCARKKRDQRRAELKAALKRTASATVGTCGLTANEATENSNVSRTDGASEFTCAATSKRPSDALWKLLGGDEPTHGVDGNNEVHDEMMSRV